MVASQLRKGSESHEGFITLNTGVVVGENSRKLLLTERDAVLLGKGDVVKRVVRPFLSYLSIWAFENIYAMGEVDMEVCEECLLGDLFDEGVI